ncbi:C-type lectin domain family 2 member B-like [Leptodactylus fuscus]|uniref:C-type lectin domain family 2 member B-like n=1 Tax=Leptodactylus fuscus TaxID=238119 RepID=UPI003F4F0EA7
MKIYGGVPDTEQETMSGKAAEISLSQRKTQKKERWVIVGLLLVIAGLIAALIITNTKVPTDDITGNKNQNSAPCDDDWIWYRGKCYYFSTKRDTWENSLEYCKEQNATLALIDNREEYEFLFRFKGRNNHWIGLRRTDDNTGWTWINGTIYKEDLFPIKRSSPENIQRVFLNHEGVNSEEGFFEYKWICNKT